MSHGTETNDKKAPVDVRILGRVWEEDEIWNVSAFDLPVVASGKTMKEAQSNFEDAVETHFMALSNLNRLETTVRDLQVLTRQRDFYEARLEPHVTVQNFPFSPERFTELSVAGS